jgi:type II secretory pathway pseudopilin PulG
MMAMLVIAAGVAATSLAFNIRRDREEELLHRASQYKRAIREYSKKTGRFPMRLEELDSTNGMRYLRKHYKDPITREDFKFVYLSEVAITGAAPASSAVNLNGAPGFNSPKPPRTGTVDQTPSPASVDANTSSEPDPAPAAQNTASTASDQGSTPFNLPPVGMIVGVVSASKDRTIREFSGKNHYDQWRFYYDPAFDQFALTNAPTIRPGLEPEKLRGAKTPAEMNSPDVTEPRGGYQ